jgi:hypothetical protein
MTINSLQYCLSEETQEIIDKLLGEFMLSCLGKNDMSVVSAMLAAAAIMVAAHCQRTGQDFEELSAMAFTQFTDALKIVGDQQR